MSDANKCSKSAWLNVVAVAVVWMAAAGVLIWHPPAIPGEDRHRDAVLADADRQVALQECQRAYAQKFAHVPPDVPRDHEDCQVAVRNASR